MDWVRRSVLLGVVEMVVLVWGVSVAVVELVVVPLVPSNDCGESSLNSSSTTAGGMVIAVASISAGKG